MVEQSGIILAREAMTTGLKAWSFRAMSSGDRGSNHSEIVEIGHR